MSETVTFANFDPRNDSVYDIGDGVIEEMAHQVGHKLASTPDADNLGELGLKVGPTEAPEDREISQSVLGLGHEAFDQAKDWINRSGLLEPVTRSFLHPKIGLPDYVDAAIVTGGTANWMESRADKLINLKNEFLLFNIGLVVLASGNRTMLPDERPDVTIGMTENNYMSEIIRRHLNVNGIEIDLHARAGSDDNNVVADLAVQRIADRLEQIPESILVVSNGGTWVQNAGQIGRAMVRNFGFEELSEDQLFVVSDESFIENNTQPREHMQGPSAALGLIIKSAQEFTKHQN